MFKLFLITSVVLLACGVQVSAAEDLGDEGYVDSDGVKIHYVTAGKGPLLVMIHGFPDFWYTWRAQMPELARHFQVVAVDMRGYNKSDQPSGVENYALPKLVGDIDAVVRHFKADKAVIVGHDWGGIVAWSYAMTFPDKTDRLVILNLPHPKCLARELANNPAQQKNSQYARDFQSPDAVAKLLAKAKQGVGLLGDAKADDKDVIAQGLSFWVKDGKARKKYIEAFKRSNVEGMLNYYQANYPREPYTYSEADTKFPPVKCPVLMFHGLKDTALLPGALNDTWKYLEKDLTLITIPGAGHFVQQDAADKVTKGMVSWLTQE